MIDRTAQCQRNGQDNRDRKPSVAWIGRSHSSAGETDVSGLLARVSAPTLVMHSRDDARVPFDQGRRLAAGIPGARFVPLASPNHLILEDEPARR